MKILAILPTYNEAGNITKVLAQFNREFPSIDILHIDDNSPDGTGEIANELKPVNYRQIRNLNKLGLGKAYIQGFQWAISKNYDLAIAIDSDGSHHLSDLDAMLDQIEIYDLVIGSRWIKGGKIENWPWYRVFLSKLGTWYAKKALKLDLSDLTSGYRIYRVSALREINLEKLVTHGYAFQIEMAEKFLDLGYKVNEVPITFTERNTGKSKMTPAIAIEAIKWITTAAIKRR